LKEYAMNTRIAMALVLLASMTLVGTLTAVSAMSSVAFASDEDKEDKDDDDCKLPNGEKFPGVGPGGKCPPGLEDRDD
jgi:hypothetical protein